MLVLQQPMMMEQPMMMAPQQPMMMEQPMMMAPPQPMMMAPQPVTMPAPAPVNSNDPEANAPPGYKFAGYAPEPTPGESYPGWDFRGGKWIYKGEPEPQVMMSPAPMMMAPQQPMMMEQPMMMAAPQPMMSAQPMMMAPGYGYGY
jgi:hypothetical protein